MSTKNPYPLAKTSAAGIAWDEGYKEGEAIMVGGTVIEVIRLKDKTWVNCQSHLDQCAIYIVPDNEVQPGDSLWWQGVWAMWSPIDGSQHDVKIERIGFSGVPRPVEKP